MRNESAKREMSAKRRVRGGMPGFGTLASELDKLEARVLFAVAPLPPVVSITQVTGEAWEAAPSTHPGVLRLTRTGSTATALTVTLGIQGTAVAGTNYKLTGPNGNIVVFNGLAQVTIPIGAASADITIVPLEDNTANGPLTVQVIVA